MNMLSFMMEGKILYDCYRIHINPIDYANHFLGALLT